MAKPSDAANYIYRMGTAPNTRAAISQKNKVFSYIVGTKEFKQIGVLSEFGQDESRTIDPVRGVGFGDQIAELVPSVRALFTFFEGCWFNSYSKSSSSDAAITTENSSVTVTDILDGRSQYGEFVDTGLSPVQANGTAGSGFSLRFAGNSATVGTPNI